LISAVLRIARSFSLAPERWPIIQRRINGKKLQMDGVFADGRHVATGIYEVLKSKGAENFGTSVFRVTVDEAAVVSDVVRVLERLSWSGMYNAECVVDDQGVAHLIDINGRLGGAVSIVYRAGVDLPWLWYCASAGRDIGQDGRPRPLAPRRRHRGGGAHGERRAP
jgi:predicted ATP-grasp superfamily ATP-dependent carboligase